MNYLGWWRKCTKIQEKAKKLLQSASSHCYRFGGGARDAVADFYKGKDVGSTLVISQAVDTMVMHD